MFCMKYNSSIEAVLKDYDTIRQSRNDIANQLKIEKDPDMKSKLKRKYQTLGVILDDASKSLRTWSERDEILFMNSDTVTIHKDILATMNLILNKRVNDILNSTDKHMYISVFMKKSDIDSIVNSSDPESLPKYEKYKELLGTFYEDHNNNIIHSIMSNNGKINLVSILSEDILTGLSDKQRAAALGFANLRDDNDLCDELSSGHIVCSSKSLDNLRTDVSKVLRAHGILEPKETLYNLRSKAIAMVALCKVLYDHIKFEDIFDNDSLNKYANVHNAVRDYYKSIGLFTKESGFNIFLNVTDAILDRKDNKRISISSISRDTGVVTRDIYKVLRDIIPTIYYSLEV